ncbi:hypothetical protein [Microcystis phage Mae-Yong1326-1]|nr:hypothetical protein [Microcystis phage Mae-Yong1326-1]
MCEPASLIGGAGVASSVLGSVLQTQQNAAMNRAVNRVTADTARLAAQARAAERARQLEFQNQAFDRFNQQVQDTGAAATQQQAQSLADRITGTQEAIAAGVDTAGFLPGQDRADGLTREQIAGQIAQSAADARRRVAGLARTAGFEYAPLMWDAANNRFGADLGLLGNQGRASLALSETEQNVPSGQIRQSRWASLPQILSGAGQMAARYGASRGGFG